MLFSANAYILENLDLRRVPPGPYELIALPLKLHGAGCRAGARGAARAPGLSASVPTAQRATRFAPISVTRDFGPVRALDALSLDVPKGIVFGFLGPNGAGKTTAIRVFLGLIDPTGGTRRGARPRHATRRRGDSYAMRRAARASRACTSASRRTTTSISTAARGTSLDASRQERIRELLTRFGLWDRRDDPVGRWSRGMKQKLAVARAVLHRPDLVFLDEPTSGLDPVATAGLARRSRGARGAGGRDRLPDDAQPERSGATLRPGRRDSRRQAARRRQSRSRLRARRDSGRVDIVRTRPDRGHRSRSSRARPDVRSVAVDDDRLRSRSLNGASVAPIVAWLVQHDVGVEEVRKARATLEDAFLDLMGPRRATAMRRRHDVIADIWTVVVEGMAGVPRSAAVAPARRPVGTHSRADSRRRRAGAARTGVGASRRLIIGYWPFLAATMVSSLIADSVAGERERHTLETLLASRLSDSAILIGKIIAAVLYGVGFAVANLLIGLVAVNVAHRENGLILFGAQRFVVTIVLTILASLLMAGIGVFISLRASTVKQAQQAFGIAIIVLTMGPLLLFNALELRNARGVRETVSAASERRESRPMSCWACSFCLSL